MGKKRRRLKFLGILLATKIALIPRVAHCPTTKSLEDKTINETNMPAYQKLDFNYYFYNQDTTKNINDDIFYNPCTGDSL